MLDKLYNIVLELSNKIESIEQKIDILTQHIENNSTSYKKPISENTVIQYIPLIDFDSWVHTIHIQREHVNIIFRNTILEGFKQFIQEWFSKEKQKNENIPIILSGRPKILYVFQNPVKVLSEDDSENLQCVDTDTEENTGKWILIDETIISKMIECIWKKMLEFYFTGDPEPGTDETVRDINKKKLIDMRKGLTEKHLKEIERFLPKLFR